MDSASRWGASPPIDETIADIEPTPRQGRRSDRPVTAAVRRLQRRVAGPCGIRLFRTYDPREAATEASDAEVARLAGPLGRLQVEDVRWDVIGAAHGGKRRRI